MIFIDQTYDDAMAGTRSVFKLATHFVPSPKERRRNSPNIFEIDRFGHSKENNSERVSWKSLVPHRELAFGQSDRTYPLRDRGSTVDQIAYKTLQASHAHGAHARYPVNSSIQCYYVFNHFYNHLLHFNSWLDGLRKEINKFSHGTSVHSDKVKVPTSSPIYL